jgi:hypothetical protein
MHPAPLTRCRWKGPPTRGMWTHCTGRCVGAVLAQKSGCQGSPGWWVALGANPTINGGGLLVCLGVPRRASVWLRRALAVGPVSHAASTNTTSAEFGSTPACILLCDSEATYALLNLRSADAELFHCLGIEPPGHVQLLRTLVGTQRLLSTPAHYSVNGTRFMSLSL